MKNIIINAKGSALRAAVIESKSLENLFIDKNNVSSIVGNIYIGKIARVLPSIRAAFVDIGIGKNGFLQLKDNQDLPLIDGKNNKKPKKTKKDFIDSYEGKYMPVQVVKEEIGTKGVRLETELSLPGRFLVFMPRGEGKFHISRKIVNKEHREYLKEKVIPKLEIPKDSDVIIRTAAAGVKLKFLARDLENLLRSYQHIKDKIHENPQVSCIHEELDLIRKIIRDWLDERVEHIFIDDKDTYENLKQFIKKHFASPKVKLRYYKSNIDIFDKFGISRQIEKLYEKKVWLKCGGYIIVEKTEALVAIDVNTGKNVKHATSEETILETNLQAAHEIARQLRLRNLGGMVIIDFIDMRDKAHQREVLKHLQAKLEEDKAKTKVYPFTRLGLVQMTRQRVEEAWEQHYFVDCERCHGTGRILSAPVICDQLISKINRFLVLHRKVNLNIRAHSEIIDYLLANKGLDKIESDYNIEIGYLKDDNYHPERYLVIRKDTGENILSFKGQ